MKTTTAFGTKSILGFEDTFAAAVADVFSRLMWEWIASRSWAAVVILERAADRAKWKGHVALDHSAGALRYVLLGGDDSAYWLTDEGWDRIRGARFVVSLVASSSAGEWGVVEVEEVQAGAGEVI